MAKEPEHPPSARSSPPTKAQVFLVAAIIFLFLMVAAGIVFIWTQAAAPGR